MKGRLAVDIEWNAKDGNLDRDISAYRAWYDTGVIDGAILITKDIDSLRPLIDQIWSQYEQDKGLTAGEYLAPVNLRTSTTTSIGKARERILRGDGRGCPILIIGITQGKWDNVPLSQADISVKLKRKNNTK